MYYSTLLVICLEVEVTFNQMLTSMGGLSLGGMRALHIASRSVSGAAFSGVAGAWKASVLLFL